MTDPDQDLLTTSEGVDEGSAASTVEGPASGAAPAAGSGTQAAGEAPTPPVDMETPESREAREQGDPGQQLQVGEG